MATKKNRSFVIYFLWGSVLLFILWVMLTLLIIDDTDDLIVQNWFSGYALIILIIIPFFSAILFNEIGTWLQPRAKSLAKNPYVYLIRNFENRALGYQRSANLALASLLLLIVSSSIVFYKAAGFVTDDINTFLEVSMNPYDFMPPCEKAMNFSSKKVDRDECKVAIDKYRQYDKKNEKEYYKSVEIKELLRDPSKPANIIFLMIVVVRIGDVAFASFITYFLVKIYRYKIRLAAFYQSRSDALLLIKKDDFYIKKMPFELLPILLDPNFDFGDQPSLAAPLADMLRALSPVMRKSG